jgi:ethanolamine ammonia-lyase large subunit
MEEDQSSKTFEGMSRRGFLAMMGAAGVTLAGLTLAARQASAAEAAPVTVTDLKQGEDVFAYISRVKGSFDQKLYPRVIGAANDFKEGDQAIGVGADDEATRKNARALLANTKIKDLYEHPLLVDSVQKLIWNTTDQARYAKVKDWTMGQLKEFLLTKSEAEIKGIMYGLTSDTIGCVPKLMSNEELIALGKKIFNVIPGTKLGAKGYMGARIQPNSPTDNPDDVQWQTFNAFAYAAGDIVIGTNPVDSQVKSNLAVQRALKDVVEAFKLKDTIPWCVLAHIDVQGEVRKKYPGTVETMFQSLAGTDDCNKTFDVTVEKILNYAKSKKGE